MFQHYSGSKVRQVPVRLNLPETGLLWAAHSTLVALSDDRRQISAASAKCAPATPIRPKSPQTLPAFPSLTAGQSLQCTAISRLKQEAHTFRRRFKSDNPFQGSIFS